METTSVNTYKRLSSLNERPDEQQLNVWLPKSLVKKLKVKGVDTDKSLKNMVIEALHQYLHTSS